LFARVRIIEGQVKAGTKEKIKRVHRIS